MITKSIQNLLYPVECIQVECIRGKLGVESVDHMHLLELGGMDFVML